MSDLYTASRHGGAFADDDENPTVELSVTPIGARDGAPVGYAVEGDLYPYRKYDDEGKARGDFSDFQFTLDRTELEAVRDMLTDILDDGR